MVRREMAAEKCIAEGTELTPLGDWSASLEGLHARIAHRFPRSEVRERVRCYLSGLLGRVERKNGWQLAEAIGDAGPQGVQRLLNNAKWDADSVRDDLKKYVVEHLADEKSGLLIVDETGFLKKGEKSVGVRRQYTGTAGETVNAQVGVFLAYASKKGTAFVDRALYLPKEWIEDPARCAKAGIPQTVGFATKIELAKRMLKRAFEADVPAQWVVADSFYGRSHGFRHWLEKQGRSYAVMVPKTNAVRYQGRRKRIDQLIECLPEEAWTPVATEAASNGKRPQQWVCLMLSQDAQKGMRRWLLGRRSRHDPDEVAFYQAYGRKETSVEELVRICQARWTVEEGFAEAKGEVGLNHYEVRKWKAWHRYVTLCLLAHAFLVVTRLSARSEQVEDKRGIAILPS